MFKEFVQKKFVRIFRSLVWKNSKYFREFWKNLKNLKFLAGGSRSLDDRQITHLICVRLKHLRYDFLGGILGLLPVVSLI